MYYVWGVSWQTRGAKTFLCIITLSACLPENASPVTAMTLALADLSGRLIMDRILAHAVFRVVSCGSLTQGGVRVLSLSLDGHGTVHVRCDIPDANRDVSRLVTINFLLKQ